MRFYKWKPSKAQKQEFKNKMEEIDKFCTDNNISVSSSNDSYYFHINGVKYRVSNHSIEASNKAAYNSLGVKVRECYHDSVRDPEVVYIHASKTRIIEIYNNLKAGYILDGRGKIKKEEPVFTYESFKNKVCDSLEKLLKVINNTSNLSELNCRIREYNKILKALKTNNIFSITLYCSIYSNEIKPEYFSQLCNELEYLPMLH